MYDGRRADRCVSRWGLEARVPFLDPEFIRTYWSICSSLRKPTKSGIEKFWLREAFNGLALEYWIIVTLKVKSIIVKNKATGK